MVGKTLGHYEVLEPLGAGGMGEVFRARDTTLDRDVAIKVLHAETADDPERLARFEREAKLLAALNHPNIATIHGLEVADGVEFIAMELVEGTPLSRLLAQKGRLEVDEALHIAVQIAGALAAAHDKSIIHRDLKPSNITWSENDPVKVLDFGLAKPLRTQISEEDLSHTPTISIDETRSGVILGTASYMSPEQARGGDLDERTDIWSFGCVLYEMITGRKAFTAANLADTMVAVIREEPDWAAVPTETPATLQAVIVRCLHKEPGRRYASGRELADELAAIVRELQSVTGAAPAGAHGEGESSSALKLVAGATAVLAVALALSQIFDLSGRTGPPLAVKSIGAAVTWPSREAEPRISPDGQWLSFISDRDGTTDLFVRAVSGGDEQKVAVDLVGATGQVWSPDGTKIAYLTERGNETLLEVIPMLGGPVEASAIYPSSTDITLDRWVGDSIYLNERLALVRFDVEERTFHQALEFTLEDRPRTGARMRPDGSLIVYSKVHEGQEDLWISAPDGSGEERLTDSPARDFNPTWVGNDHVVFRSHRSGESDVWALELGDRTPRLLTTLSQTIGALEGGASTQTLALVLVGSTANLASVDTAGSDEATLTHDSLDDFWPDLSAEGGTIAFQRTKPVPSLGLGVLDARIYVGAFNGSSVSSERVVVDDGFWPLLSADAGFLSYVKISPPERDAEVQEARIELQVMDVTTRSTAAVTDRFRPPPRGLFPMDWSAINARWAHTSSTLFFVAFNDEGNTTIRSARMSPEGVLANDEIVAAEDPGIRLEDLLLSNDDRFLLYTKNHRDGRREIFRRDLHSGDESLLLASEAVASARPHGWLDDGSVIVLRGRSNPDATGRIEVLSLGTDGDITPLGEIDNAFDHSAVLDPETRELYLVAVVDRIHELVAYSLVDGSTRPVAKSARPNTTFSGLRLSASNKLLFSRHERIQDIWLIHLDS